MGDIDGAFGDVKEASTIAPHYPQVSLAVFFRLWKAESYFSSCKYTNEVSFDLVV